MYIIERHCLASGNSMSSLSQASVKTDRECDDVQLRGLSVSIAQIVPLHDDKPFQISNIVLQHRLHHRLPHVLLAKSLDGHRACVRPRKRFAICALESNDVEPVSNARYILKVLLNHVE